jgi:hypothetical protein
VPEDSLERRDLLKLAASACLTSAAAGCASPTRRQTATPTVTSVSDVARQLDPEAARALLAKIDARMDWIRDASLPEDVLPMSKLARTAGVDGEVESTRTLVRQSVRTLYLTGRFLDMPDTMKAHPGVQARLRAMQPEMDDAVLGMTARLERMTADDHRRVQSYLAKDELFADRLAVLLEKTAADDGLSFQRTFGVRSATLDLAHRMAAQSPALVVDPLVRKVRRIEAHPRSDAEEARRLAARVGEQAFWEHQERLALLNQAWQSRIGLADAVASSTYVYPSREPSAPPNLRVAPGDLPPPDPCPRPTSTPGQRTMSTGGSIMGFGLGSVAIGLIIAGIANVTGAAALYLPALIMGVTIGPILLVTGLIVVIVGAIMKANE